MGKKKFPNPPNDKIFDQKAQLYTDDASGEAANSLTRAYDLEYSPAIKDDEKEKGAKLRGNDAKKDKD